MDVYTIFRQHNRDDPDEDLETHLAKRRAARSPASEQNKDSFTIGENNAGRTSNQRQPTVSNKVELETKISREQGARQEAEARVRAAEALADKGFNQSEDCRVVEDEKQSRSTPARTHQQRPPLSADQLADETSASTHFGSHPAPRLLSSFYDSSSEESAAESRGTSASTRNDPYLSGVLLSCKESSKAEALAKLNALNSDSKKRKRQITPTAPQQPVTIVIDSPTLPAKMQHEGRAARTQFAQASNQVLDQPELSTGAPLVTSKPDLVNLDLQQFLSKRIKHCRDTLTQLGGDQPTEQQAWRALASDARPDVNTLASMFYGGPKSAQEFKDAVSKWEKAFMLRVNLHRQVTYAMLARHVQQRQLH